MAEAKPAEEQKDINKRNWADEEDDGADEEDVEIGGGKTVGQAKTAEPASENAEQQQPRTIMPPKPRQNRTKNIYGDYVVTKINVKEREVPKVEDEEEEESSEESEEEVDTYVEKEEEKKGKFIWRKKLVGPLR